MYQAVDSGNRHHVVVEDLVPGTEGLVRSNHQTGVVK